MALAIGTAVRDQQLRAFGESITVTDPDSTVHTLTALVGPTRVEQRTTNHGLIPMQVKTVHLCSDSTNTEFSGLDEPNELATVTISSVDWTIENVRRADFGGLHQLELVRVEAREVARANHFGDR